MLLNKVKVEYVSFMYKILSSINLGIKKKKTEIYISNSKFSLRFLNILIKEGFICSFFLEGFFIRVKLKHKLNSNINILVLENILDLVN